VFGVQVICQWPSRSFALKPVSFLARVVTLKGSVYVGNERTVK